MSFILHIAVQREGTFFRWRKMEGAKKNIVDRMLIGTNVLLDYLLPLTQAVSCQDIDDVEQDKLVS